MADTSTTKRTRRPEPVADGHRRVRWVYNPDNSAHGSVVDMPEHDAHRLMRENRVAYVDPATPLGHPVDDVEADEPVSAAAASAPPPAAAASK